MTITDELQWTNGMDILSVSCKGLGVTGEVKVNRVRCDVSRLMQRIRIFDLHGFWCNGLRDARGGMHWIK